MNNVMRMIMACGVALVLTTGIVTAEEAGYVFEPLPYAYDALEPHLDAQTMEIHYSRHHRGYFRKMLKALQGTDLDGRPLKSLFTKMSKWPVELRNNAGGHWNHSMFWRGMSPQGGGKPMGDLAKAINENFGSFERFKQQFNQAAAKRFGSGWVWLCVTANGTLFVTSTANQDNPLMDVASRRGTPILGLDVWEHAYYLKYQNNRGRYVEAFWNVVNWPEVANRYEDAKTVRK